MSEPITKEKKTYPPVIVTKLQLINEYARSLPEHSCMPITTKAVLAISDLALAAIDFHDAYVRGLPLADAGPRLDAAIDSLEAIP
jgi:hypothetical protein